MRRLVRSTLSFAVLAAGFISSARTVVYWQDHFPTVGSVPVTRSALEQALNQDKPSFADLDALVSGKALSTADLLVMPYGSAFPAIAWPAIHEYLNQGGNLLVLGGQPFRVPVSSQDGRFTEGKPVDAYSRELGILHTYEAPQKDAVRFAWKDGYSFLPSLQVRAERVFVLESHRLDGLGYLLNANGEKVSAPVVVSGHLGPSAGSLLGSRWLFLDFQPSAGYWDSTDGISLIRTAAEYARQGATSFSIELQFSTIRKGEAPQVIVHLRNALTERRHEPQTGQVDVELLSGDRTVSKQRVDCSGTSVDAGIDFPSSLAPGFYTVQGTYTNDGKPREFYQNGFWVEDDAFLKSGPALASNTAFLTQDGKPFFPFGTNYFSTESNGWDFSGPRNAFVWERDFADMERHNVSFVRTGVWNGQAKITDGPNGGVSERFLRNLEAYLLSAHRHHIAVNFTFFAFDPQSTMRVGQDNPVMLLPGSNPYLDPVTIRAEQDYMLSIVNRFKDVPYLCWDLINEPSFSSPHHLWHGNTPNADPVELEAWHTWLRNKYHKIESLAASWSVAPSQLGSFDSIPLPGAEDLAPDLEHGDFRMVRASDYNLFAQDSFSGWVKAMVSAIRFTGSRQLIDVGQDEGGVENRVLNQFYAQAGLSFTTNHTYRQNQSLVWDSLAAKAPGVPNIVGETGYQPVTYPNGDWRFDELTGFAIIEQKWAAGFAGGTSGALSWDWDREIYFGIQRSDGSSKIWEGLMRDMGAFAKAAQSYATPLKLPEVAIVLPQSLQLSVFNRLAIEAQQKCIRALYGYARSEAYVVGEDQIASLGAPKLIILPSPWVLNSEAWDALLAAVKNGAVLLVSGRFDLDPHFMPTDRPAAVDISYEPGQIDTLENKINWPAGSASLTYGQEKTNILQRAALPGNQTFVEKQVGKGKILFSALPLELNDNLTAIGEIYKYALNSAGITPIYSTDVQDPGILICPTILPHATLYVISSQTDQANVGFRDVRSGKQLSAQLQPGRAALLLVADTGDLIASYNWH